METLSHFSTPKACAARRKKDRLLQHGLSEVHSKKRPGQDFTVFVFSVPCVVAVLCYFNGLDGHFVHDDIYAIKENSDVTGKTPVSTVFENDFWGKPMCDNTSHKSYRPLTVLTFRWDYYLSGGTPRQFHAVNVVLHAFVTYLFARVLRHVLHVQDAVTMVAALLFAVHPVHTEAVTGIVGRAELLSCIGILLSLICYHRSLAYFDHSGDPIARGPSRRWRVAYFSLATVACGAAMLCKEHGITGLGICAILDVFIFSRNVTRRWLYTRKLDSAVRALLIRLSAVFVVGVVLLWYRLGMLCGQMPAFKEEDNPASFSPSFVTRVLTFNYLVALNAWLLLCPRVLSYDWQTGTIPLVTGLHDVRNIATVLVYVVITSAGVKCLHAFVKQDWTQNDNNNNNNNSTNSSNEENNINDDNSNNNNSDIKKKKGRHIDSERSHVMLTSLVLMTLPFLPSSNLFLTVGFVLAERVLYFPSLGFCLLVAQGAVVLWQRFERTKHRHLQYCLGLSGTALLLLMAFKTVHRNQAWLSRQSLFWSGLQTLPNNAKMHYNYANFLKDGGHLGQAEHHYRTAISLYDKQPSYHNNLGTVVEDGREAEQCYKTALRLNSQHRGALVNLGNILINRNDSSGEQLLHQALSNDPNYIDALLSLSQLELRRMRWDRAEIYIKRALTHHPHLPDLYNFYGIVFHKTGQYEEAVASYERAVSLNNKFSHAMTNAAASLRELGRHREAELFLKRAVEATDDVDAMGQLGRLYQRMGRTQDAVNMFTLMARKAPNDTDVILNFVHTLMDNGEMGRAEQMLSRVLSTSPHNADLLFAMGHVQEQLGDKQEAMLVYQEASRRASNNAALSGKIFYELGNLYKDLQQYRQALESYQSALQWDPTLTHAHHNLGALYHLMGQYDLAQHHYQEVLKAEPDNQVLLQNMAKLQRAARNRKHTTHSQHSSHSQHPPS